MKAIRNLLSAIIGVIFIVFLLKLLIIDKSDEYVRIFGGVVFSLLLIYPLFKKKKVIKQENIYDEDFEDNIIQTKFNNEETYADTDEQSKKSNKTTQAKDSSGANSDLTKETELNLNYDTYISRGVSKIDLKDYKGSLADFNKAIELNPNCAIAYRCRGVSKGALKKDYNGAIADYTKALELDPNFSAVYFHRGCAKTSLEDYNGAISDYSKAIELNPNDADAYINLAGVYYNIGNNKIKNKKDYKKNNSDFSKAIELNPDYADFYKCRGSAKADSKDYKGSLADFNKAIELNTNDAMLITTEVFKTI